MKPPSVSLHVDQSFTNNASMMIEIPVTAASSRYAEDMRY